MRKSEGGLLFSVRSTPKNEIREAGYQAHIINSALSVANVGYYDPKTTLFWLIQREKGQVDFEYLDFGYAPDAFARVLKDWKEDDKPRTVITVEEFGPTYEPDQEEQISPEKATHKVWAYTMEESPVAGFEFLGFDEELSCYVYKVTLDNGHIFQLQAVSMPKLREFEDMASIDHWPGGIIIDGVQYGLWDALKVSDLEDIEAIHKRFEGLMSIYCQRIVVINIDDIEFNR